MIQKQNNADYWSKPIRILDQYKYSKICPFSRIIENPKYPSWENSSCFFMPDHATKEHCTKHDFKTCPFNIFPQLYDYLTYGNREPYHPVPQEEKVPDDDKDKITPEDCI